MWLQKIEVRTGTSYPEELSQDFLDQITQEFSITFTPLTKIDRLLRRAGKICKEDDSSILTQRFAINIEGEFHNLDKAGKLSKLLVFLGNPRIIDLEYVIGIPDGLGIAQKNGIYFFFHTKELGHVPHIHAKHQSEEISIEILTLKVKGKFRNNKKQKEAIKYVKNRQGELLKQYNQKTNGIHIPSEHFKDGSSTPLPR